jgi:hypothetical protein
MFTYMLIFLVLYVFKYSLVSKAVAHTEFFSGEGQGKNITHFTINNIM